MKNSKEIIELEKLMGNIIGDLEDNTLNIKIDEDTKDIDNEFEKLSELEKEE